MTNTLLYIGTYTQQLGHVNGQAEGIYVARFDSDHGTIAIQSVATQVINPSFVIRSHNGRYLYATQELEDGIVSAFRIDPTAGDLSLINSQSSGGAHPCHLSISLDGAWLLVANYSGGTLCALPILDDGSLAAPAMIRKHDGLPAQHDAAHPHSTLPMPDARYVLAADCGLDRIYSYRIDDPKQPLLANDPAWIALEVGAGPRHLALHPNGAILYCINEHSSTVSTLRYNPERGSLRQLQTLSTLPAGYKAANTGADIHVDHSGHFVYCSNRGHNNIAIFAIDQATSLLEASAYVPTGGRTPRSFALDSSGTWLLAANQDSSTIVSFKINQATGMLIQAVTNPVPTPVCIG